MKKKQDADNINYYEILLKLREYEHLLINTNNIAEADINLLKIRTFIYSENFLQDKLVKYSNEFKAKLKTDMYKAQATKDYEIIKELNNHIKYFPINHYGNVHFEVQLENGNEEYDNDFPYIYYFPSLSFSNKNKFISNKIIKTNHIRAFIECFLEKEFKTPENLEFYICNYLPKIYLQPFADGVLSCFLYSFFYSAIYFVIFALKMYVLENITYTNKTNAKIINQLREQNLLEVFKVIKANSDVSNKKNEHALAKEAGYTFSNFKTKYEPICKIFNNNGVKQQCKGKSLSAVKDLSKTISEIDLQEIK